MKSPPAVPQKSRRFEGSDFEHRKNGFELPGKPDRVFLESPISQFRYDNDAGKNLVFTYCGDAGCAFALWISNQIGDGIGVEKETHPRFQTVAEVYPLWPGFFVQRL